MFEGRSVEDSAQADAERWVQEAIEAGRLPVEPPDEVVGAIAAILRQHYRSVSA